MAESSSKTSECVILLHGLGRTKMSMFKMERALKVQGYQTRNVDYPSRKYSVEQLAEKYLAPAVEQCIASPNISKIHFVTHSMGGILVRVYLQEHPGLDGSRLVMLAPPNKGSGLADYFKDFTLYKWILGPAGQEMGTSKDSVPNSLKPIPIEVGVIGGTKSFVPWLSQHLQGPDDGRVALEETKLEEMKDFAAVESDHALIMNDDKVIFEVIHFLKKASFKVNIEE